MFLCRRVFIDSAAFMYYGNKRKVTTKPGAHHAWFFHAQKLFLHFLNLFLEM